MARFNELAFLSSKLSIALLRVDFESDEVLVISNSARPVENGYTFSWRSYALTCLKGLFGSNPTILQDITSNSLKRLAVNAQLSDEKVFNRVLVHSEDLTALYSLNIVFKDDGFKTYAYITVTRDNEQRLLHSIVKTFIFNVCDYFVRIEVDTDHFSMISTSSRDTPLPMVSGCYTEEMHRYNKLFVAPEDYEHITALMEIESMVKALETQQCLTFYSGLIENGRYARKKLEARYFGDNKNIILLYRTDVTQIYNEERLKVKRLEEMLERAYTDALTSLLNHQGMESRCTSLLESLVSEQHQEQPPAKTVAASETPAPVTATATTTAPAPVTTTANATATSTSVAVNQEAATVAAEVEIETPYESMGVKLPVSITTLLQTGTTPSQAAELNVASLQESISGQQNLMCALLFVDLDNFKQANDKFGHPAGDEVLQQTALIIKESLRGKDLAGRMGGDEFEILLVDIKDKEYAQQVAQHILSRVESIAVGDGSVQVSCSIGIAYTCDEGFAYKALVAKADRCVYRAKSLGKGQVVTALE